MRTSPQPPSPVQRSCSLGLHNLSDVSIESGVIICTRHYDSFQVRRSVLAIELLLFDLVCRPLTDSLDLSLQIHMPCVISSVTIVG